MARGGALEAGRIKVMVNGREAAGLGLASGEQLQPGDSVRFYAPATEGLTECEIRVGPEARRMGWAYAEPRGEGAVWTGVVRTEATLPFEVTHGWQRYLLMGFERGDALVIDVSDPLNPRVLFDYAVIEIPGQSGLYLSHDVEESAACIAIQLDAVRDITEVTSP